MTDLFDFAENEPDDPETVVYRDPPAESEPTTLFDFEEETEE